VALPAYLYGWYAGPVPASSGSPLEHRRSKLGRRTINDFRMRQGTARQNSHEPSELELSSCPPQPLLILTSRGTFWLTCRAATVYPRTCGIRLQCSWPHDPRPHGPSIWFEAHKVAQSLRLPFEGIFQVSKPFHDWVHQAPPVCLERSSNGCELVVTNGVACSVFHWWCMSSLIDGLRKGHCSRRIVSLLTIGTGRQSWYRACTNTRILNEATSAGPWDQHSLEAVVRWARSNGVWSREWSWSKLTSDCEFTTPELRPYASHSDRQIPRCIRREPLTVTWLHDRCCTRHIKTQQQPWRTRGRCTISTWAMPKHGSYSSTRQTRQRMSGLFNVRSDSFAVPYWIHLDRKTRCVVNLKDTPNMLIPDRPFAVGG